MGNIVGYVSGGGGKSNGLGGLPLGRGSPCGYVTGATVGLLRSGSGGCSRGPSVIHLAICSTGEKYSPCVAMHR